MNEHQDVIERFLKDNSKYKLFISPRRSGKTMTIVRNALLKAPTGNQIIYTFNKNSQQYILDIIASIYEGYLRCRKTYFGFIIELEYGSKIIIDMISDTQELTETNKQQLRGNNIVSVYIDEPAYMVNINHKIEKIEDYLIDNENTSIVIAGSLVPNNLNMIQLSADFKYSRYIGKSLISEKESNEYKKYMSEEQYKTDILNELVMTNDIIAL